MTRHLDADRIVQVLESNSDSTTAQIEAWAADHGVAIRSEMPDGRIVILSELTDGLPRYRTTHNRLSGSVTRTDRVYPGHSSTVGLNGSRMRVGLWDAGVVLKSHQEFGPRIDVKEYGFPVDHSTHVAGTIVASGHVRAARGMAFAAQLDSYDWNKDGPEMARAAEEGLLVSNHSYGVVAGWFHGNLGGKAGWYWFGNPEKSTTEDAYFGAYNGDSEIYDRVTYYYPYLLPVIAAGNDRGDVGPESGPYYAFDEERRWTKYSMSTRPIPADGGSDGYDTIAGGALAKNVLSVGSVGSSDDGKTLSTSSFSSFGPADDGRVKPDLVGYGENVFSTVASGTAQYASSSGTSMAAPNVSGSLILLQELSMRQQDRPFKAATLKGLVLHTARDLPPHGPDYRTGWGLLDTEAAALQIRSSATYPLAVSEHEIDPDETFTRTIRVVNRGPLRVSLCWTDAPWARSSGRNTAPLDDRTPLLVRDLDIELVNEESGAVHYPFVLNPANPEQPATTGINVVDTYEQVFLADAPEGLYTLRVRSGLASESAIPFSLIVTGAYDPSAPLHVSDTRTETEPGSVHLEWDTAFEFQPGTYRVERSDVEDGTDASLPSTFHNIVTMPSTGAVGREQQYAFDDTVTLQGRYLYRIFFQPSDGGPPYLAAETFADVPAPPSFFLHEHYPNPFGGRTSFSVDVPFSYDVGLFVYDVLGRRVATAWDGRLAPGRHRFELDASGWAPGHYFLVVEGWRGMQTRTLVVVR